MDILYISTFVLALWVDMVQLLSFSDMETLYSDKITGINTDLRPQANYSQPTNISLGFSLTCLREINAVEGTMAVSGYFYVHWFDDNLRWNPYDYNNASVLVVSYGKIWRPPLIVVNAVDGFEIFGNSDEYMSVTSQGFISWFTAINLEFMCEIDATDFPFDRQKCIIEIISWGYSPTEIRLALANEPTVTNLFRESSEWTLTGTSAEIRYLNSIQKILFTLEFQRRPLYAMVSIIFPIFLLATLNIGVYLLPQESGERVSYSVTMLLSLVVFMTMAQSILPAAAMPRLSAIYILMLVNMALSGIIIASIIASSRMFYRCEKLKIPKWTLNVVKSMSLSVVNQRKNKIDDSTMDAIKNNGTYNDSINTTWEDVAKFWDMLCLVISSCLFICNAIVFIADILKPE